MQPNELSDLAAFAQNEFGGADLGDARLERRLLKVAEQLAADPGSSIPSAMSDWSSAKGAYRFFANEEVTREGILDPHYLATAQRIGDADDVLVVMDSTYLNYTHHPATEGLGRIGSVAMGNKLRGVLVHSALAVAEDSHRVLGMLDQIVILRTGNRPPHQQTREAREGRARESSKWLEGIRHGVERAPRAGQLVFVFDREGDTFEALELIQDLGARFVIRGGSSDRRLETIDKRDRQYLLESVRQAEVVGRLKVALPAGSGRRAREAEVTLRSATYGFMPPKVRKKGSAPRQVNVLWVHEEHSPKGQPELDWLLITSEPVDSLQAAERVVRMYRGRWKIEEWHKTLKTGCKIEARQLEDWSRLDVLLGLFSVIGWRLLVLRDAARGLEECPQDALTKEDRVILQRVNPKLSTNPTARDYLRAIAKLGGFLCRKGDGEPGWITLWRGYTRLCDMRVGFAAARGR